MIKIDNVEITGWDAAIRGMRNPMESWNRSDSYWTHIENPQTNNTAKFQFFAGNNDLVLMVNLANAGSDHGKFLRMITVTFDITAPLYWWKEFDTYKVGTVANSCSTMHKIHNRKIELDDFSCEHLSGEDLAIFSELLDRIEINRRFFNATGEKENWYNMIQLLPTSYNQLRTVQLNYAVLKSMYHARKNHKLDEWRTFCEWCESLPYFKEVCISD